MQFHIATSYSVGSQIRSEKPFTGCTAVQNLAPVQCKSNPDCSWCLIVSLLSSSQWKWQWHLWRMISKAILASWIKSNTAQLSFKTVYPTVWMPLWSRTLDQSSCELLSTFSLTFPWFSFPWPELRLQDVMCGSSVFLSGKSYLGLCALNLFS